MPVPTPTTLLPLVLIAAAFVLLVLRERLYGRGPVIQESRPLPDFHTIDCQGALDVTVICGQDPHVAVATTADSLSRVRTTVVNGVLRVRLRPWGWLRPSPKVALDVSVPQLQQIITDEAVHVAIANAERPPQVSGTGTVRRV